MAVAASSPELTNSLLAVARGDAGTSTSTPPVAAASVKRNVSSTAQRSRGRCTGYSGVSAREHYMIMSSMLTTDWPDTSGRRTVTCDRSSVEEKLE
jgi:hypothetical protein